MGDMSRYTVLCTETGEKKSALVICANMQCRVLKQEINRALQ